MIHEVTLPEISENVESGDVIEVMVKVGDFVDAEQPIVQLETEKAAFDVPSPVKGKIVELMIQAGQTVKVGQGVAKIDTDANPQQAAAPSYETKEEPPTGQPEPIPEPKPTPKPQPQPQPGVETKKPTESRDVSQEKRQPPQKAAVAVPAAPSVRQRAREMGIDLSRISSSAPGGRITMDDLDKFTQTPVAAQTDVPAAAASVPYKPLPDFAKWGEIERRPTTVTRKKIAETLSFAWSTIPQVTQHDHADITLLEEFRKEYGDQVRQAGGKLTVTSILLKAVTMALQKFENFNTTYDPQTQEIIYKKYYHIAVAVDTDRGLLVPVIKDVDKKSLLELSVELSQLAEKARNHKVSPDDMVGGNFTISNLGGIGGTGFSPILYWPQTGILGVSRSVKQPVYVDGVLQPRLIMPLSLTYDHRIIDGAEGIRFLHYIVELLEKPFLLTIQDSNK